ncbi:MAG: division/cell wall cluster transcriptional repressor MraZ [Bacteroidales bacterium]|nr:division/cell wall cluster transcriptional repressor MraZ [Bacteroidales bacterium]
MSMVSFIGTYSAKVDDKGRLVFPAGFKRDMPAECDLRFVIKKSLYSECLDMYSYEEWEKESQKIRDSLDMFNPDHVIFWREYMRNCAVVEPDTKLGRFMLPHYLLDAIGINKEVVFLGMNFKIEIWGKEKYEAAMVSNEAYVSIAKSLARK